MSKFEQLAEKQGPKLELIKEELKELGIEPLKENIEIVSEQQDTSQFPGGFENILENIEKPEELKEAMEEKSITSIIHSEGENVWDHVKLSISNIEKLDISEERKKDLKLIMLYHDIGKTVTRGKEVNIKQTQKGIDKGTVMQSMIGHDKERLEDIENGLKVNGISGPKLETFMIVIKNHMKTSILDQAPEKIAILFDTFGKTEEEVKEVAETLCMVLQVDGNATEHIDLVDGELKYSKNNKKTEINFSSLWRKYEEGKKIRQQKQEKLDKQNQEKEFEKEVFGKKLTDYLMQDKGLKPGPEMGKKIGEIKKVLAGRMNTSPKETKQLIDKLI